MVNYDSGKIEQFLLKLYHFPSFYTILSVRFVFASCSLRVRFEFATRKNRTICVYVVGAKLVFFPERCKFFGMNFQLQFYFILNKITMDCKVGIAKREKYADILEININIFVCTEIYLYLCIKKRILTLNTYTIMAKQVLNEPKVHLLIRDVMRRKGISAEQLAQKLGLTVGAVQAKLRGNITLNALYDIAQALDCEIADFFPVPQGYRHWTERGETQAQRSGGMELFCPKCGARFSVHD
jgi:DNA-binding Xre family transcriptional regulator